MTGDRMTPEERYRARYRDTPPDRPENDDYDHLVAQRDKLRERAQHAIQTLSAELSPDSRSFLLSVKCRCGSEYVGIPVAELTGVLDVGLQLYFSHLGVEGSAP